MLLLNDRWLDARRIATRGPLAPLADSLAAELEPVLGQNPYIPESKALLSRAGGRCERDGAVLEFDPRSPDAHRCPTCGTVHRGELHHRGWVTHYQLWLAERAVQAALFHVLRGEERHAAFARDVLAGYAERYLAFPNRDNVLGPTRLFFSTYLESIWLLQICVAADLLAATGDRATIDMVRERIVEPSASLTSEYDEGHSNRQVWNNAALMAAAALRGDDEAFERVVLGPSGLQAHLSRALFPDGTWYEGENYHLFALRGLWYAVTMCEARGMALPDDLVERFQRAFAAPILTALPDLTMPARKDSQYRISLRQWRIAELVELGFARRQDVVLGAALRRFYDDDVERRDGGRARSTADIERNSPESGLTRADLGWRALLHALPQLPPLPVMPPRSVLLQGQGLAVFRRETDAYVALDYGQHGGGHGHPDRLNLLLSVGDVRWLDDLGTGSYVDRSLHWYRSTLAHNAPLVNGVSQPVLTGELTSYEEREALGWIEARIELPGSDGQGGGTSLRRTVVVAPDYLVDELHWSASHPVRVELPWHLDAVAAGIAFEDAPLEESDGPLDAVEFVREARRVGIAANGTVELSAQRRGRSLRATFWTSGPATLHEAQGPGQPATEMRRFHVLRAEAVSGTFRAVIAWTNRVVRTDITPDRITVMSGADERHEHSRSGTGGWCVEFGAGGARSSIELSGAVPRPLDTSVPKAPTAEPVVLRCARAPDGWLSDLSPRQRKKLFLRELSESHYRRSEDAWTTAGAPRATVALAASPDALVVFAIVQAGDAHFAASSAVNPYDNEHPDTMAAGVQLYLRDVEAHNAWMFVPEAEPDVRVRPILGTGGPRPEARWRHLADGYEVRVAIPMPRPLDREFPLDVDVIVNETVAGRERRRGQLVLSGAQGEFVYLRGDRHDPDRYLRLVLVR